MLATPRSYARLALPLPRNLEAIIAELEASRPVLVLHNYGLPFWPRWHYAVVVGYDPADDVFVLRSGEKHRQVMRSRRFMLAWHYGGRWSMVVLRPGETAALDDPRSFLEAAADFEKTATPADARATFDSAVERWPLESVAFVGRGTAEYRRGGPPGSGARLCRGLAAGPHASRSPQQSGANAGEFALPASRARLAGRLAPQHTVGTTP